ncbi:MAG: type II secretion system GspH family protein [Actinobacteria bacterium]|nr:type II secretion system GspH family protein [Actinomycetota bacterium]
MKTKLQQKGFTIIELLIVIVVIGILATITAVALGGANARARDAKRESDVKSLQTAIEAYYTIEGSSNYPTEANMNDTAFRDANFQGLDESVYQDPNAADSTLATTPTADQYAYEATPAGCDNTTTNCDGYTLTITLEEGDEIVRTNLQ